MRLFLALALAAMAAPARAADALTVRVYHTNDVHGWIMARPDKTMPGRLVGGSAAFKALVDKDSGPKLVLDAGDWWQGTPEGSLDKGAAVAGVMNLAGYDAAALGNHEFDMGVDGIKALTSLLKLPALCANAYGADGKRLPGTVPWIVKEVAGVKFGIFGLVTVATGAKILPKYAQGLTFRRETDEARDAVKALKKEGADVIVAVTHVGFESEDQPKFEGDQTIAREVAGIDLIVGGHTHTNLSRPWRDPAHGTLIVQAGSYLLKAGRVTLKIDPKTHRVVSSDGELVDLYPQLGEDAAVKAAVSRQTAAVGKDFETVVATASAVLAKGPMDRESPLGSWMADCYKDWSGTDGAIQNWGGMRADLPAGPVTLRHLFDVMPYDNMVVKLRLKGRYLREALAHGAAMPRLVQIGGMTADYHAASGGRTLASAAVGGVPLDDAKSYSVATLDFLVSGGEGYESLAKADAQELTGVLARDVLRACAEKQKIIAPPVPGRLKSLEK